MPKRTAMLMERTGLQATVTLGLPANITLPTVPSAAQVNQPLLASPGTWTNNPTSFTFQWHHLGSAVVIGGAQSYTPVQADVGFALTVSVFATNGTGQSLLAAISLPTLAVIPAGPAAARVYNMLQIFGVSGHAADYAGLFGSTPASIVADAQYLGISFWRDGINAPGSYPIYSALYAAGIRLISLPFPSGGDLPVADWITFAKNTLAAVGAGSIFALEGPNEPSISQFTFNGFNSATTWQGVSQWQSAWYTAVHNDPVLSTAGPSGTSIPVTTPTLVFPEPNNWGLQYLQVPPGPPGGVLAAAGLKYADIHNSHLYPMFQGRTNTIDPSGDSFQQQLSGDFVSTQHAFAGDNIATVNASTRIITEYGYQTSGGSPTPNGTICDLVTAGKCMLNALLNAWVEGFSALCIYTFYEDAGDGGPGFGLLTSPANPKTTGLYLHNFTTILNDSGAGRATFNPTAVNFTLVNMPATGASQLFEKSNGAFELVLWNKVQNWNIGAGTPITVAPTTVTVNFGISQPVVNTYDPTLQQTPIATANNVSSVNVALRDYPMIVELPVTTGLPPVNTVLPALSTTTPITGTQINLSNGTWTGSGITFTYAWMRAYPTPNVLVFTAANGGTVSAGTVPNFVTENASKAWSITNPDTQTLIFQVNPGDIFPGDIGQPGAPCRSDINGSLTPFIPGTEIEVFYDFSMTSLTARTEGGGIIVGEFHNDDVALGGATQSPFFIGLAPFDFMEIIVGNLASSPAPTNSTFLPAMSTTVNGIPINYYQLYTDPNPIVRGHNYEIQIQIKFGPVGFVNVFRDGVQIISSTGQFGFGFNTYWKCGIFGTVTAANQVARYQDMIVTPGPLVLSTAATYTPAAADIGAGLTGSVTATNNFGAATATTLISSAVLAPAVGVPVNTSIPIISPATPQVGQVATSSDGIWTNSPTSWSFQWNTVGAPPVAIYNPALVGSNTANQGFQFRQLLPSTALSGISGTQVGLIRVGFGFAAGTTAGTLQAFIGEAATGGNPSDMNGAQVRLTFAGFNTATGISGAQILFSDFVPFTISSSSNIVIAFLMGGTTVNLTEIQPSPGNLYYSNTVLDPSASVANGLLLQAGFTIGIEEIDFEGAGSTPIPGASGTVTGAQLITYTPQAADVGKDLTVTVFAHNPSGQSLLPATSVATNAVVSASVPANITLPSIPAPNVGVLDTANNGTWTNSPTSFAYQWNHAGFITSNGQIIGPNGSSWIGRGMKVGFADLKLLMPSSVSLATLNGLFPNINFIQLYLINSDFPAAQPYISTLTAAGIVVCLQDDVQNEFGLSQPINPITGANLTTSVNFVKAWATTYKANPYVWFTTMNEPQLFSGPGNSYNLAAITAEQLAYYNGVRGIGNNSMFIFDASGNPIDEVYPSNVTAQFANTFNVAWDVHYYNYVSSFSTIQATVNGFVAQIVAIFHAVTNASGSIPVTIMEYGDSTTGGAIDNGWQQAITAVNTVPNIQCTAAFTWGGPNNGGTGDQLGLDHGGNPAAGLSAFGALVVSFFPAATSPVAPTLNGAIPGATAQGYTPVATDEGFSLTVSVTASNLAGPSLVPATSAPSAQVPNPGVPVVISAPTIVGSTVHPATLASSQGQWTNAANCWTYQWNRSNTPIPGATNSTYTLGVADVGNQMSVTVTASNGMGNGLPSTSQLTATVT